MFPTLLLLDRFLCSQHYFSLIVSFVPNTTSPCLFPLFPSLLLLDHFLCSQHYFSLIVSFVPNTPSSCLFPLFPTLLLLDRFLCSQHYFSLIVSFVPNTTSPCLFPLFPTLLLLDRFLCSQHYFSLIVSFVPNTPSPCLFPLFPTLLLLDHFLCSQHYYNLHNQGEVFSLFPLSPIIFLIASVSYQTTVLLFVCSLCTILHTLASVCFCNVLLQSSTALFPLCNTLLLHVSFVHYFYVMNLPIMELWELVVCLLHVATF